MPPLRRATEAKALGHHAGEASPGKAQAITTTLEVKSLVIEVVTAKESAQNGATAILTNLVAGVSLEPHAACRLNASIAIVPRGACTCSASRACSTGGDCSAFKEIAQLFGVAILGVEIG